MRHDSIEWEPFGVFPMRMRFSGAFQSPIMRV
jgi:hypothetical protein